MPNGDKIPEYGIRNEHTSEEEIVYLPTGNSNQTYYQPEVVLNPEGCDHSFKLTNIGKREIECEKCQYSSSFVLGNNAEEANGSIVVKLRNKEYIVST